MTRGRSVSFLFFLGVGIPVSVAAKTVPKSSTTTCVGRSLGPQTCPLTWGGPGFDRKNKGSRFSACCAAENIEIWVDAAVTVASVSAMEIRESDKRVTRAIQCWKAQRHPNAPSACSFPLAAIRSLGKEKRGRIAVFDAKGKELLSDSIDVGKLKALAHETQ